MSRFVQAAVGRLKTAGELLQFLWHSGLWWLIPVVAVLLLFALFFALAQATGIAPFIYTLF